MLEISINLKIDPENYEAEITECLKLIKASLVRQYPKHLGDNYIVKIHSRWHFAGLLHVISYPDEA